MKMLWSTMLLLLCGANIAAAQESVSSPNAAKWGYLAREHVDSQPMFDFASLTPIPGNASVMIRDFWRGEVNVTLNMTEGLTPGDAYTFWVIVFNNPARCKQPYACSDQDFEFFGGDPRVRVSAFQGGTFIPQGVGGTFNFNFHKGRTSRPLFPGSSARGCTWLRECEIHIATRTHGPATNAAEQLGSYLGGCDENNCFDNLFAVHRSPNAPTE